MVRKLLAITDSLKLSEAQIAAMKEKGTKRKKKKGLIDETITGRNEHETQNLAWLFIVVLHCLGNSVVCRTGPQNSTCEKC